MGAGRVFKRVLGHIAVFFPELSKPAIPRFPLKLLKLDFVALRFCLIDIVKNLFGSKRTVNLFDRL